MKVPLTGNGNPVADGELAGPGAEAWLTLGVRLESVAAELEETNRRYRRLWETLHRVQITGPEIPAGVAGALVNRPDLLGPRRGWYWDVRRITFATGTQPAPPAGMPNVLALWKNAPVSINVVDMWTQTGPQTHLYGKAQLLLGPDEHLVYGPWNQQATSWTAAGYTIIGEAIQVAEECLPLYLT